MIGLKGRETLFIKPDEHPRNGMPDGGIIFVAEEFCGLCGDPIRALSETSEFAALKQFRLRKQAHQLHCREIQQD